MLNNSNYILFGTDAMLMHELHSWLAPQGAICSATNAARCLRKYVA